MGTQKLVIHHNLEGYSGKYIGMLLPIGVFLNRDLSKTKIGAILSTWDGFDVQLIAKAEIGVKTALCDALCWQLYGHGAEWMMQTLHRNYESSMDDDVLLYIVVRKV